MARRLERLEPHHVPLLHPEGATCCLWQRNPLRSALNGGPGTLDEEWVRRVNAAWGSCGRVLYVDGDVAGHLVWAPAPYLPAADAFPTSPVSPDAVVLAGAYVGDDYRSSGLGRILVQTMAKDLVRRRDVRAVEAFGGSASDGMIATDFLLSVGFGIHRPHPTRPRLRLDLRQTLRVREGLGQVWGQLVDRWPRPVRPEAPAGRMRVDSQQPSAPEKLSARLLLRT